MSGSGSGSDSIGTVSNLDPAPEAISLIPGVVQAVDVIEARKAAIGDGTEVRRLLPQRTLRTIGAWCFLDHYGPDEVSRGPGMQVPPHPHIGLQTVELAVPGAGAAPGQPRQPAADPAGRAQPDDRGPGHHPLGGVGRADGPRCCTACSCGSRCPRPNARGTSLRPPRRPAGGARRRRLRDRGHRRVPGRAVSRRGVQPARRVRGGGAQRRRLRAAGPGGLRVRVVAVDGSAVVAARSSRPGCSRTCRPACPDRAVTGAAGAGWPGSSWSAAAVRRAPADVVELRGAQRRGDHPGPRGLGGRAVRRGARLPRTPLAAPPLPPVPLPPR